MTSPAAALKCPGVQLDVLQQALLKQGCQWDSQLTFHLPFTNCCAAANRFSFKTQDTQSLNPCGSSTCLDTSRAAYLLTPLNLNMRQIDMYVGGWPLADGKHCICKLVDPRCNVQGQVSVAIAEVAQQLMRGLQAATAGQSGAAAWPSDGVLHLLSC